jgi:mannose-6-phosphate isomerase-like protein (cupin superfamily)
MFRMDLLPGAAQPLHFFSSTYHVFVESGSVVVRNLNAQGEAEAGLMRAGEVLALPRFCVHGFSSIAGAVLYLFGERTIEGLREMLVETEESALGAIHLLTVDALSPVSKPTTDVREKYWGRIETILSDEVAAKRIFVQQGGQGSLEFHVEKRETYYIHSGLVRVGLRIGRAENRSIVMGPGESYDVRPGVMHLRIGLQDSVIIEVSTRDSDSDSYLVEDGQTYRHIDVDSQPTLNEKQEQSA